VGEKTLSRLPFEHLNLTLQSSAVVLSGTFEVIVHLLDVGHEIGKVGSLHSQCSVLLHQAVLNALGCFQHA
jgi:hypothetical protein